jgi:ABC-2 type transport system ATP-binding protein
MSTAIFVSNLEHSFGQVRALDGLNLRVSRGEVFGVLGHNGAGKTTAVRILNGLLSPAKGKVRVLGLHPVEQGQSLRTKTGVLSESPGVDERLTASEQLRFFGALHGMASGVIEERTRELADRFGLSERMHERVKSFSKGMRQRLALIRTILHGPELIFLDEPTSGLDPVATREVHQLIEELAKDGGRTIFLCTHNLHEAQRLCHRVAILKKGQVLAEGEPKKLGRDLLTHQRVEIEIPKTDQVRAAEVVEKLDGAHLEGIAGEVLKVRLPHRDGIPTLIHALSQEAIQVFSVRPEEPDLEAVYFALDEAHAHGESQKGAA